MAVEDTFPFRVYSGRGLEFQGEATMVSIKTQVGEIGILPRHCEYVGNLSTGIGVFHLAGGKTRRAVIGEGFLKFSQEENLLTILADTVDQPEEVQGKHTLEEQAKLQDQLQSLGAADPDFEYLSQQLERCRAIEQIQKPTHP